MNGTAQPAATFKFQQNGSDVLALEVLKGGHYHREFLNDPEQCEYFVPVKWLQTVSLEDALQGIGLFGN